MAESRSREMKTSTSGSSIVAKRHVRPAGKNIALQIQVVFPYAHIVNRSAYSKESMGMHELCGGKIYP